MSQPGGELMESDTLPPPENTNLNEEEEVDDDADDIDRESNHGEK